MASAEIGRIFIRVMPNTDGFREEVKAAAEKAEKQTDPIKVDVEANDTGLKESVKAAVEDVQSTTDPVKIDTELDTAGAESDAKELSALLESSLGDIQAAVELNGEQAMMDAQRIGKSIQSSLDNIELLLEINNETMGEMVTAISALKTYARQNPIKVPIQPDTKPALTAIDKLKNRLKEIGKEKFASFDPIKDPFEAISRSSGLRMLIDLHKEKFKAFANFDQIAMKVGVLGLAFQTLGAAVIASAGNLLSWGKDLASIGAIAIPIPGVLAGIALAMMPVKAAMKDFGKYIPEAQAKWQGLQKTMSVNFWAKAQAPIRDMINNLFPAFSKGMETIATNMGTMFGNLAAGFQKSMGGGVLEGMMGNVAKATAIASKGMGDLAQALTTLLKIGMARLPALAQSFNNLTKSTSEWLSEMDKSGKMDQWINTGIANLKALGGVVVGLGGIFGGLAKAAQAAGASTLQSLSDTLNRASAAVNSGPFQAALTSFLTDVYAFTNQVGQALSNGIGQALAALGPMFGQSLANLAPVLSQAITNLFNGLSAPSSVANFAAFFDGLKRGVETLLPSFEALGSKISIVFQLAGTAFANLSGILNSFILELVPILTAIQQPASDFMNAIGTSMANVLKATGPAIQLLAGYFAQLLTAMAPVATAFGSLAPVLGQVGVILANVFGTAVAFITPLMQTWAAMIPSLADAFGQLLSAIAPLTQYLPMIGTVLGTIGSLIMTVVIGALTGLISGVVNVIEGVKKVFQGLIDFVTGVFTGNWSLAWEGIKTVLVGILQTIWGVLEVWINVTLLGAIRGGLLKILMGWKGGWAAVKGAGEAVWNAIKGAFSTFGATLQGIARGFLQMITSSWSAGWATIKAVAGLAWSVLKTGMANMVGNIVAGAFKFVAAIRNMMSQALSAMRDGVGKFVAIGLAIAEGVARGIANGANIVADAARNIASNAYNAAKNFLDINSPSKLFARMSESIPEGMAKGINDGQHMAVDAAVSMAKAVAAVPITLGDIEPPSSTKIDAAFKSALGFDDVSGVPTTGNTTVMNNTFNAANFSADDAFKALSFGVKQMEMSGQYQGGDY